MSSIKGSDWQLVKDEMEDVTREKKKDKKATEIKKQAFIRNLKEGGIGEAMKKNPGKVKVIQVPWYKKLGRKLKSFFTYLFTKI